MSLEPSLTQRALSPASSGRSSPVYRNPRRLIEDGLYKKDKNLRKYASNIERALSLFDTAQQEWADYISFLARLLKAIQTHPPDVRVLPHATNVATRLAQCLNPSLPSGVHQKALEVYTCIFAIIGREVLARDISIFFPGLSTVLSFASLSVRPAFLALIEAHVITLDPEALRPALKAIIICLLPGLEEETSEEFEHVLLIFDKLKVAVNTEQPHLNDRSEAGDSFFWQCFFLATISNTTRRQGALAYLVRNLPRLAVQQARRGSVADEVPEALNTLSAAAEAVISPEPGLLVRCFASGLADQQLLVQRGFLDLLATHVPLDSPILQERTSEEDLDLLVAAATGVVLRRDMSLNRRLWSWLLGPGPGSSSNSGKDDEVTSSQDPKSPDVDPEEVRAAFFSRHGLQPLHRSIMKMIRRKSSNPAEQAKPFRICLSLMDHWEVGALLVPGLFLPLLDNLRLQVQVSDQARMDEVLRSASNFFDGVESSLIWGKMSELVFGAFDKRTPPQQMAEKLTLVKFVITHFNVRDEEMVVHHMPLLMLGLLAALNEASDSGSPDLIDNHRLITVIVEILDVLFSYVPARAFSESSSIRQGVEAFYDANHGNVNTAKPPFNPKELGRLLFLQTVALFRGKLLAPGSEAVLEPCTRLLVGLNQKVYGRESAISIDLVDVFHKVLNATQPLDPKQALPFPYIVAVVTVITTLQVGSSPDSNNGVQSLYGLVPALVSTEEGTERFAFVKMWLEELPSLDRVFDILISPLRTSRFFTLDSPAADVPAEQTTRNVEDIEDCLCSLRHILNILRSSTDYTWTTLAEATGQRPLGTYADGLTSNGQPLGENLLPLVDTLCKQIRLTFEELRLAFKNLQTTDHSAPEPAMITLMDGLEQILASAHDRLRVAEVKTANTKSPEQPQGFFGNMVSGVFSAEAPQTRSATANSRLTVILCFQDTVRICFSIWSWAAYGTESQQDPASLASFGYTSSRMRNRARRTLEHLFTAEPLECLETLAVIWSNAPSSSAQSSAVLSLLNVLSGTRPKITVPTIFNSIYSRTNPIALDRDRMSTLTSDLADLDLVAFLIDYTRSLEDDAMDEIWPDCSTFLRDVLANPLPHRQILPALLGFTAVLAEKVDNTNFGEQRRMRRSLDLFTRLLTAAFTTKPMGFLQDPSQMRRQDQKTDTISEPSASRRARSSDIVTILASVVPKLQLILVEADRITTAAATISANVIGPTFRSKSYPENVSKNTLELLYRLSVSAHASKAWRKDISDAFNDARFFATPLTLAKGSWLPLLQQWVQSEKDRLPELLDRLSPPTTAGIMFGVGASSARLEADRRTQLNLRRIAVLILAAAEDAFLANMGGMQEKLVELLTATPASSPSSATRAEVFMVLRALVLKTSSIHLASLWPIINAELQLALTSVIPSDENYEKYDNASTLQACKLLDTLITIDPDDFQLHEWLFITDTIDAVYKPADWSPVALADEVAEALGATEAEVFPPSTPATAHFAQHGSHGDGMRRPMLDGLLSGLRDGNVEAADVVSMTKAELAARVLRPFFGQLSIGAFEATYGMEKADWRACFDGLLRDLFDEGGVVG
ncbi:hypothetical protein H2199_002291 [Coniosporium tulheliwenetii]|uniref:Uncharacterized protein n=1 Tax=Coniosporium tulheliwenetii TaxID=3383036 RepID=A0ACC2ZIC6_9PEZI|nr:hypothetical protein H2199_002291 [Cladosporium sp. JES 115]